MALPGWLQALRGASTRSAQDIPDELWLHALQQFPFLQLRSQGELKRLRRLSRGFLDCKQFHGADGLQITDRIAVSVAAQACLPILNLGPTPEVLQWYDDFVGVVLYPGEMLARREQTDDAGIVHQYQEVLSGEAMQDGPVALSWSDVAAGGASAQQGYNVVIHEFVHKLDMRDGCADGCPPLPPGFMGQSGAQAARKLWLGTLETCYQRFREQVIIAERFGGEAPWLDAYGAESIDEFFAVASEAYFVNRPRFASDFGTLVPLCDACFNAASPVP